MIKQKMENRMDKIPAYKTIEAIVVLTVMCVLPWISRLKIMQYDEVTAQYFQNTDGSAADFFLYGKAVVVVCLGIFILCMLIGENIFPDNIMRDTPIRSCKYRIYLICVMLYSGMVVLSAVLSKYLETVKKGSPSECESVFVLIAYMLLFLGGMNWFCYESVCRLLKRFLLGLIAVTIILNCVEFFYRPLFEISWFQALLAPAQYQDMIRSMKVAEFTDMVALTFYNPNYYGGFCLLLFPFALQYCLDTQIKNQKLVWGIAAMGILFCILSSKSSTSFYLGFVEIAGMILLKRKSVKEWWKQFVVWIAAIIVFFCIANQIAAGKIAKVGSEVAINKLPQEQEELGGEIFRLKDIKMNKNVLQLIGTEHTLQIEVHGNQLQFTDEFGTELSAVPEENILWLQSDRFSMISMYLNQGNQLVIDLGYNGTIEFYVSDGQFYGVGQNGTKITQVSKSERRGVQFYHLFTGRGYAWVNTVPLLKKTVFLGHGTGTFPFYFQQNDYVGLLNTHGSIKYVIDKPHSMYLQTAVENGCVALVSMLVLFGMIFFSFLKCEKEIAQAGSNKRTACMAQTAQASFIAAGTFMIYGIANDSMVTVNPIFWLVLGIHASAVYGVRKSVFDNCHYVAEWRKL